MFEFDRTVWNNWTVRNNQSVWYYFSNWVVQNNQTVQTSMAGSKWSDYFKQSLVAFVSIGNSQKNNK